MNDVDWGGMVAAFGPVGAMALAVIVALSKTDVFKREDPSRNDVLDEVRALRGDMTSLRNEMTDRLARIETQQAAQERRMDRMQ